MSKTYQPISIEEVAMPVYYIIQSPGPIVKYAIVDAKTNKTIDVVLR